MSRNVQQASTSTEVSFTDPEQIEMDNAEQFEGENMDRIHDQAMEGGWNKKEQPSGCNRGGKRQTLIADNIDKQYRDSF